MAFRSISLEFLIIGLGLGLIHCLDPIKFNLGISNCLRHTLQHEGHIVCVKG